MTPAERAKQIVEAHIPRDSNIREKLQDEIRSAIIQGQNAARQPIELPAYMTASIVYQIIYLIDDICGRLQGADYCEQLRALEECRRRTLALNEKAQHA
jgi:hypothetical protein